MSEQDQQGWKIMGTFYPHVGVEALRHGDFALVREVTGLTADEFVDGDDITGAESGWIAIAFWHGHPEFGRDRVRAIVEALPVKDVERIGFDVAPKNAGEGDAGPPDVTRSSASSATTDDSSSATSTAPDPPETVTQP